MISLRFPSYFAVHRMRWSLLGEGNANLVLSPSNADDSLAGTVLRVGKGKTHGRAQGKSDELHPFDLMDDLLWGPSLGPSPQDDLAALKRQVAYVERVLGPLLGPSLSLPSAGVICILPDEAIEILTESCRGSIGPGTPALLLHNACMVTPSTRAKITLPQRPCLSVEIKPKWGIMPGPEAVLPPGLASDIKRKIPRYKLHQMLKREERRERRGGNEDEDDVLSGYDPLDLFSGDDSRMERAIEELIACPSNNLRVFVDGSLKLGGRPDTMSSQAYTDKPQTIKTGASKDLTQLLRESLLGSSIDRMVSSHLGRELLKKLLVASLKETGVLRKILEVQELDKWGIEAVSLVYEQLISALKDSPWSSESQDSKLGKWASIIRDVSIIRDYLISATAKDCSIMVAIRMISISPGVGDELQSDGGMTVCSVTLKESGDGEAISDTQHCSPRQSGLASPMEALQCLIRPTLYHARVAMDVINEKLEQGVDVNYEVQVTLVDLDLKGHQKIPKHLELDRRIMACALEKLQKERVEGEL